MHTVLFRFRHLFVLLSLFALNPAQAPAASPLRLDAIPIVYYQFTGVGLAWLQQGRFDALYGLELDHGETIVTPPDFPDAAFDKPLIAETDWAALAKLSPDAMSNFEMIMAGGPVMISGRAHREVRLHPEAEFSTGRLVNISTRAWVGEGEAVAIAGFVVEERPRTVLIRGVGPTLATLGVAQPLADPFITIFRGNTPFSESTDWGIWDKHLKSEAAEIVHAFPLLDGSKDAALLIELGPGAYTVHMGIETGGPGVGLIEVYALPDSRLLTVGEATSVSPRSSP